MIVVERVRRWRWVARECRREDRIRHPGSATGTEKLHGIAEELEHAQQLLLQLSRRPVGAEARRRVPGAPSDGLGRGHPSGAILVIMTRSLVDYTQN